MHVCFCVLIMVSVFTFVSSATEVNKLDVIKAVEVHLRIKGGEQITPKSDEGKRSKRMISTVDEEAITKTVNSLRSSVGASNMNYLTYSTYDAADAVNWTSHCDFDADFYRNRQGSYYLIKLMNPNTNDHVSELKDSFNSSTSYYELRSVYLQSVGAGETFCSTARYRGRNYSNVNLAAYVFSTSSYFDEAQQHYALGEQCTTCLSGSYWCYKGLCKGDCSDSDSNCYCNSYCLNCADTDRTTCSCRCLEGWTGARCETGNVLNATTPTCSTTPRISRTSTTKSTTSIAPSTMTSTTNVAPAITKSTNKPNDALTTSGSLKNLLFQLAFYAAVTLFLRF